MIHRTRPTYIAWIIVLLVSLISGSALAQQPQPHQPSGGPPNPGPGSQAQAPLDPDWDVAYHAETGKVRFLATQSGDPIPQPNRLALGTTPEVAARAFLEVYGEMFGLQSQAGELVVKRIRGVDELPSTGRRRGFVRFQQVYRDVPVLGGELNVGLDPANNVISVNGEILPELILDTQPRVTAEAAQGKALEVVAKTYGLGVEGLSATQPELWIYNPLMIGSPGLRASSLVWRTQVTSNTLAPIRELALVDARLGVIVLHFNQTDTAKYRMVYDNANNSSLGLPGTVPVRVEGGGASGVADVNNAYDYSGFTYDFYSTVHGRDSLDNHGMKLVNTVRYCDPFFSCPYANAFWNGVQMVYGQGYASADDVVAHELTHGVTENESGLFYYRQSGAINEALSDIWGEFVDLIYTNGADDDSPGVRWLMGEDVPGGAIRSMADPTSFSNPDRMGSAFYYCGPSDSGGVHTNSGVANKAAYLMVDGGVFNSYTVTGIGITKAAKIWYEAQTNLLTSAADYQDLGSALNLACSNLVGSSGITAGDCTEVGKAVLATQMNQQPACPTVEAPLCDSGTPLNLFSDDFENPISGRLSSAATTGANGWYYPQGANPYDLELTYATSGAYNLWGYDQPQVSDSSMQMNANVSLPAGKTAYLHFKHAYDFESTYDGGVLEYSQNGGAWTDAGSLISNNGYTGIISSSFGNPLAGRNSFTGGSNGMSSSRLNLGPLAGTNVRFRFRIGTDSNIDNWGWFIDDVRTYTCEASIKKAFIPLSLGMSSAGADPFHSSFNGSAPGWQAHSGTWIVSPIQYYTEGSDNLYASSSHSGSYSNIVYEARVKRTGNSSNGNGLFIRGTPLPLDVDSFWNSSYYFAYTNNRSFSVWKRVSGAAPVALQGWTSSSAIISGGWNVLKVIANGSSLQFYINGTLVWSGSDSSLPSGQVGINMLAGSGFDLLQVDWASLTFPGALSTAQQVSPEQQALNQAASPGGSPEFAP